MGPILQSTYYTVQSITNITTTRYSPWCRTTINSNQLVHGTQHSPTCSFITHTFALICVRGCSTISIEWSTSISSSITGSTSSIGTTNECITTQTLPLPQREHGCFWGGTVRFGSIIGRTGITSTKICPR